VNFKHLSTFVWLRWRLAVNQVRRAGMVNAIITAILAVIGLAVSLALFFAGAALGALAMPEIPSMGRLFIWVGLILMFLFFWLIGLLTALQRSEGLSIDKVLHLPVSPSGAFLINYLSSFMSLTLMLFVPGMVGLAMGEVYSSGAVMLLAFPLLGSFVFAVTGLTYQFQGWLASLVSNPRRRRTVIVLVTLGILILVQLPNLINFFMPWDKLQPKQNLLPPPSMEKPPVKQNLPAPPMDKSQEQFQTGQIDEKELLKRKAMEHKQAVINAREETLREQDELLRTGVRITRLVCGILPPGWVALGMAELGEGHVVTALAGTLGLALIGTLSLARAYRTTILMYTQGGSGAVRKAAPVAPAATASQRPSLIEWKLPWISEYAAVVFLAAFRSLMRAPEAKMLMLTPIVMLIVFGGGFLTSFKNLQNEGPFLVYLALGVVFLSMPQFMGNIFGFDRDGFRVFVLSPIPRREILLGKNLAMAPLLLGLGFIVVTGAGLAVHLRWDQFAAFYCQLLIMCLFLSLLGNVCSIYSPFVIPAGSLKGARPGMTVILSQIGCMLVSPIVVGLPTVLPTLIELILVESNIGKGLPISLAVSVLVLAPSLWLYSRALTWEGELLAERELRILEAVTRRQEG
jgi:ABC-2 type transport system permease protein